MAEELRNRLARSKIFKISDAFDICDINRNGRVNESELVIICEQRGLHISTRDSCLLF
jgi:Ca2+-binding EF-hand superfamily protein